MVIIFVLLVFVLAQAFLSVTLSGRSQALDKATKQLADLSAALSLEQGKAASLQQSLTQLGTRPCRPHAERDRLARQLSDANLAVQAPTVANARLQSQFSAATGQADAARQGGRTGKDDRHRTRQRCRPSCPIWRPLRIRCGR